MSKDRSFVGSMANFVSSSKSAFQSILNSRQDKIKVYRCGKCGQPVGLDQKKCHNCGAPLSWKKV